jgi:hypothetical protein
VTLETAPLYLVAFLVIAILGTLAVGVWKGLPSLRRFGHALDDIVGEPARPGVDARPGLVERMANVEEHLTAGFNGHTERLERIEAAVEAGRKGSEHRLDEHGRRLDEHGRRLDVLAVRLDDVARRVDVAHPPGPTTPGGGVPGP